MNESEISNDKSSIEHDTIDLDQPLIARLLNSLPQASDNVRDTPNVLPKVEWKTAEIGDDLVPIPLDLTYKVFNWNKIPGEDDNKLIDFLIEKFDIDWVKKAKFQKVDEMIILSDGKNMLSLRHNKSKVILDGKNAQVTREFIAKEEKGDLNIYDSPRSSDALPKCDVVVITWTAAEWAALDHVFCNHSESITVSEETKKQLAGSWQKYSRDYHEIFQYLKDVIYTNQGNAPSMKDRAWGFYRMVKIAEKNVLLFKSSLHLAQDGASLPLTKLINRICVEAKPKLFLSIGTAGGVRKEDNLGCALITNKARFHLLGTFKDASFNGLLFESDWTVPDEYIKNANKLVLNDPEPAVLPISPQYPDQTIEPNPPQSTIKIAEEPIITTDVFLFGTTKYDLLDKGCIVEMDDAVVAMVCRDQEKTVDFGFVRNVSDPVINSKLPREVQRAWAGYIYERFGLRTSFNGALGAWAAIAGTK